MKTATFVIGLVLMGCWCGRAAEERYGCERLWPGTIKIDGKLDEAAWKVAFGVQLVDAQTGEKPRQATEAKVLWDRENLYVAFKCEDRDIWSTPTRADEPDYPAYREEAVEVFVAPGGAKQPVYGFALNPLGALLETRIWGEAPLGVETERWWKATKSLAQWAVQVEGTVNDATDEDTGWEAEMAIPLRELARWGGHFPQAGEAWRMNLCRLDWPADATEPERTAWAVVGAPFDAPDKFGQVEFRDTFFYRCHKVKTGAIKVDGALDEEEWTKAKAVGPFRDTYTGKYAKQGTVAKMLWDEKNLYLGFQCDDVDVWSTMRQRDEDLWNEEVVEAFIVPPLMRPGYFEFEINPLNTVLDLAVINPTGGVAEGMYFNKRYDARGMVSMVKVDGTVDNRDDVDRGWTVEVAIPFADLVNDNKPGPSPGNIWRIGLYRCEVGKVAADSEYTAWSPTGTWFHIPGQFGAMVFEN